MTLPTGAQYELAAGDYRVVVTEVGATLRSLTYQGADVIAGFAAEENVAGGRGQHLLPWPNRIRDGRYTFQGATQQLPLSEPDRQNAIHGLSRWAGWQLVDRDATSLTCAFTIFPQKGWPTVLACTVGYRLAEQGLDVEVTARNTGDRPAPFGYGVHPYLTVGEQSVDELEVCIPAGQWLRVDERMLPVELTSVDEPMDFRTPRRLGGTDLDTAFTDLRRDEDDRWRISIARESRRTTLWADQAHRWAQVFTGDRRGGLAVEPMTCGPDAFNPGPTASDAIVLRPDEDYHGRWGITAG